MAQRLSAATTADQNIVIWHLCQRLEFFSGHKPLVLKQLTHGNRTSSYQVQTDRGHYVVRHYGPSILGVCRQQELRCQHAAAAEHLAPEPLCLNNHQRMLITEFLPDAQPPLVCYIQQNLEMMANMLATLHRLKVQTPVLDPGLYLQQLKTQLTLHWTAEAQRIWLPLQDAVIQLQRFQPDIGLCHMDVHQQNLLLWRHKLWLIDFEYCQLADVVFDLVAVMIQFNLTKQAELEFLEQYSRARGQVCSAALRQKVEAAKIVYLGLCWFWYWQEEHENQDPRYKQAAADCYHQLQRLVYPT